MHGWGGARKAARLLSAAACVSLAVPAPAAQQLPPGDLDPSAPMDAMPDLGVDWPDIGDAPPASPDQPIAEAPEPVGARELRFALALEGLEPLPDRDAILAAFDEASALRDGDDDANAAQIERRTDDDAELLVELLRSRGYFDAEVEPEIERSGETVAIRLVADPGAQYVFRSVELPGLAAAGEDTEPLRRAFAVRAGDPVIAEDVIAGGLALKIALGEQGFALANVGDQQVVVDHDDHSASLVLPVDPGPVATFGAIRVGGSNPPFDARHVERIARFDPGDKYQRSDVDDLRRALIATGLVASAEVKVVPGATPSTVDLAVELEPAPMRTIAGELGYGTGEGIRAEASWQHRNFFPPEGALTVRGVAGTREQLASVQFRRNNFRRRDQVINLGVSASRSRLSAYDANTVQLLANVERQSNIIWRKKWTWSIGTELVGTDERGIFEDPTVEETRRFGIAAFPASLYYDGSDSLLDPSNGFRLGGRISPEISFQGGSFSYARAQVDASAYRPLSDNLVAAGRIRLGTIVGAASSRLAPSRRFYSGGGGSVRGFGYQQLGPQDFNGDPIGGRGLAEFALEARYRLSAFGGNFGIVPFIDGGTLTPDKTPDFKNWSIGAGIGVRYYSSFGPIRIDVGTPLTDRSEHAPVAVAVSLGQAF